MTYLAEPTTAAEVLARARAVQMRRMVVRPPEIKKPTAPTMPVYDGASLSPAIQAANRFLDELCSHRRVVPEIVSKIVSSVAVSHGVSAEKILGISNINCVAKARHEAIRRVAEVTGASTPQIGDWFGRNHSSIYYVLASDEWRAKKRGRKEPYAKRDFRWKTIPEWYDEVIEARKAGMSWSAIERKIGVENSTIRYWVRMTPEQLAKRGRK